MKPDLTGNMQQNQSKYYKDRSTLKVCSQLVDYRDTIKRVPEVVTQKMDPIMYYQYVQVNNELVWKKHIDQVKLIHCDLKVDLVD